MFVKIISNILVVSLYWFSDEKISNYNLQVDKSKKVLKQGTICFLRINVKFNKAKLNDCQCLTYC